MKIIRKIIWIFFLFFFAFILFAIGYYYSVTKNVALSSQKLIFNEKSITVFDGDNQPIKNVAALSQKQTFPLNEIPQHTKTAFICTEDKRFYQHAGFDWRRIAKATLNNVKAKAFKEGASTISQQLIKNTHLTNQKTFKRKLQELKLTLQLEKHYTKNQILERYLNTIYFGHNCFGIKSAADFYFEKSPNELNLAESAILAGLVKSPNFYSPFKHPENCNQRKKCILTLMLQNNFITKTEYDDAIQTPLPTQNTALLQHHGYLNGVFDELSEIAEKEQFTIGGNIEIFTYMNANLQSQIENISENISECNKKILAIDNKTAGITAYISDIGNIYRLPGSIIKPLLVYTPALEENYISPATPILDEKVNYSGYAPENYDKTYHGYVSVRECVEKSLNIPAVKILSSIGTQKAVRYLEKLNLPTEKEDESLALALGGMKKGFPFQNLVNAYMVYPNEGNFTKSQFISKIKINGLTVFERKCDTRQVFSPETAYLMTDMLKSTAQKGTAKKLRNLPMDIAAKTGTVGTEKGNTDAYAIAYSTRDTIGVWMGNQNNAFISDTGGGMPCNLLSEIYEYLYNDYQAKNIKIGTFPKPNNIVSVALDKISYYDTHTILKSDPISPMEFRFTELFKENNTPSAQSLIFSQPSIISPTLKIENNCAVITFSNNLPTFYKYKIERYDYDRHTTLYFGDYIPSFTDNNLQNNKNYIYTVTPVYKNYIGTPIQLPIITTKDGNFNIQDSNILKEDWWNY